MSTYAEKVKKHVERLPQHNNVLHMITPATRVVIYETFESLIAKFVAEKLKPEDAKRTERWIKESFEFNNSIQKITKVIKGNNDVRLITSEQLYLKALYLVNPFLMIQNKLTLDRMFMREYSLFAPEYSILL